MKYLIVYAHPNPKSFNHAVKEQIVECLKARGRDCVVRDLYSLNFSPVLGANDFAAFRNGTVPDDIRHEQELIKSADRLIFIFPIWWFSMPAILKGYIDRVFSRGFAYDFVGARPKGLLAGKKVMLFTTTGGPRLAYLLMGALLALKATLQVGIFGFCGMKLLRHVYFYQVPTVSDAARKLMLERIKHIAF